MGRHKLNKNNCSKCKVELIKEVNWSKSGYTPNKKGYLNRKCKECFKQGALQWAKEKPDDFKEIVHRYQQKNKVAAEERQQIIKKTIPAGIYTIYNYDEIVYIGESEYPYKRRVQHFSKVGKQGGNIENVGNTNVSKALGRGEIQRVNLTFKMREFIDDTDERKAREKCLIQRHRPRYNDLYV